MPRSTLRKYIYYIFTEDIWSVWNPMQVIVLLQKRISFVEQRVKSSYFKGSIIS